jgi:hypothetical protein
MSIRLPARPVALVLLSVQGAVATAQDQEPPVDRTRLEIDLLNERVDDLEDELARLRAQNASGPRSPNVFNPGLTVFGNTVMRLDDRPAFVDDDPAEGRLDDRFHFREVELDFRAAIDPWADGVVLLAIGSEVPGEFATELEEGYVLLKRVPVLEAAPGGLKLQVGRFRPEFGRFNQIHLHDLPQPTYPRALGTFLGPEGLVQEGVSAQFFLPIGGESSSAQATLAVMDGGGLPIAEDVEGSSIASLARVKWFQELGDASHVELGVSALENDSDHQLYGFDATYKWTPPASGQWNSFLIGGELFQSRLDDPALGDDPMGWYLWSQFQIDRNLYVGARHDHTETVTDASLSTSATGIYLTYYTTEFLRLRLGGEHVESDLPELDGLDSAVLEVNFVFGSHPVEPYWVNR